MIKDRQTRKRLEINLGGPEGNAFVLLGYAKRFCKDLSINWEPVIKEMTSGNYENLISVFDKYFGTFVTLYRR